MAYEKIVTVYDTEAHAREAVSALEKAGFSTNDISLLNKNTLGEGTDAAPAKEPGFWGRLLGGGVREHEAEVYGRAVDEGGYVVTLRVPDTEVDRAMKILDTNNTVDVHERATSYGLDPNTSRPLADRAGAGVGRTAAGLAGGAVAAAGATAGRVGDALGRGTDATANAGRNLAGTRTSDVTAGRNLTGTGAATGAAATSGAAAGLRSPAGEDEVLRLAEEQINVGKRQVETGTTRIRRFVTERPVEEKVSLHEEHAEVLRRAVADPSYIGDIDWSDSTIEIKETAEQAVVNKTTRLAEEVVVRKQGTDHVETVQDKVRRQQVEVEHLDAAGKPGNKV